MADGQQYVDIKEVLKYSYNSEIFNSTLRTRMADISKTYIRLKRQENSIQTITQFK